MFTTEIRKELHNRMLEIAIFAVANIQIDGTGYITEAQEYEVIGRLIMGMRSDVANAVDTRNAEIRESAKSKLRKSQFGPLPDAPHWNK